MPGEVRRPVERRLVEPVDLPRSLLGIAAGETVAEEPVVAAAGGDLVEQLAAEIGDRGGDLIEQEGAVGVRARGVHGQRRAAQQGHERGVVVAVEELLERGVERGQIPIQPGEAGDHPGRAADLEPGQRAGEIRGIVTGCQPGAGEPGGIAGLLVADGDLGAARAQQRDVEAALGAVVECIVEDIAIITEISQKHSFVPSVNL